MEGRSLDLHSSRWEGRESHWIARLGCVWGLHRRTGWIAARVGDGDDDDASFPIHEQRAHPTKRLRVTSPSIPILSHPRPPSPLHLRFARARALQSPAPLPFPCHRVVRRPHHQKAVILGNMALKEPSKPIRIISHLLQARWSGASPPITPSQSAACIGPTPSPQFTALPI